MKSVNLTPASKVLPSATCFSNIEAPEIACDDEVGKLVKLSKDNKCAMPDAYNIYTMADTTDHNLSVAHRGSYPYRGILQKLPAYGVPPTREWMVYWELFSDTLGVMAAKIVTERKSASVKRFVEKHDKAPEREFTPSDFALKAFIIHDNDANCVSAFEKTCKALTCTIGAQVDSEWLATHTCDRIDVTKAKFPTRWLRGVDGDSVNTANMRAWKNRITTSIKRAHVVVSNSTDPLDACGSMVFAVTNLAPGGCAIIRLNSLEFSSVVSSAYMFTNCFETSRIIYVMSDDRMYLVGESFLGNVSKEHQRVMFEFMSSDGPTKQPATSMFVERVLRDDTFVEFRKKLAEFNSFVWGVRSGYCQALYDATTALKNYRGDAFVGDFTAQTVAAYFKDKSDIWVAKTGLDLLKKT